MNGYKQKKYGEVNGKTIIDNMISNRGCEPLIVVSFGYGGQSASALKTNVLPYIVKNYSTFVEYNKNDSDSTILGKVKQQRNHFALAGLSNGAQYTLSVGLAMHSDYFSWFGCFSGASLITPPKNMLKVNHVYFTCGKQDPNNLATTRYMYKKLQDNSDVLKCSMTEMAGEHEWKVWYTSLYNVLQIFFK